MSTPEGKPETLWEKLSLYGCGLLMVMVIVATVVVVCATSILLLSLFLPLSAAVLLGLPVAAAALALWTAEESTIFEKSVTCLFILIVSAILAPVFLRAKRNAQRLQERNRPTLSQPAQRS